MKATKAIVLQRVELVMKLRSVGALFHDIRAEAAKDDPETGRPWNVSDRTLLRYISKSDDLMADSLKPQRRKLLARAVVQREALFARCMESGDWRAALAVLDSRDRLLGLFPDKPMGGGERGSSLQINVYQQILRSASDEELSLLARLAARAEQIAGGIENNDRNKPETNSSAVGASPQGAMPEVVSQLCGPHVDLE